MRRKNEISKHVKELSKNDLHLTYVVNNIKIINFENHRLSCSKLSKERKNGTNHHDNIGIEHSCYNCVNTNSEALDRSSMKVSCGHYACEPCYNMSCENKDKKNWSHIY